MEDGLYVIAGETFDTNEIIAGWRLFRKLKKKLKSVAKKALKIAAPVLSVASFAMPALAPAAAAATMASRFINTAKKGHRPARAAMRLMGRSADRGDVDAQRFMSVAHRVSRAAPRTLLNAGQMRELARRARQGNPQARRMMQYVAGMADGGDPSAQALLEQAAGTTRWDLTAGHDMNADLEIEGGCVPPWHLPGAEASAGQQEIIAGGPLWDYLKPRRGFRSSQEVWGPRDAYRLGLESIPARR